MKLILRSVILVIYLVSPPSLLADASSELAAFDQTIEAKFDDVNHIKADQLTNLSAREIILFDVRQREEYEVSHLEGAIRVPPAISNRHFIKQFAAMVPGKTLVFYCSVGYRSSALIENVQDDLRKAGSRAIYNLEGGIFNWHNQRRALVNRSGASDDIHPYDQHWGQLLERSDKIRYRVSN